MKCGKTLKQFCFAPLLFLLLCVPTVVPAQTPELDKMFSQALNSLENSANKIDSLQSELSESRNYINSLKTLSSEQKQTLLRQGQTLEAQSTSLQNINQQLIGISNQLLITKEKLARAMWWVKLLGIILAAWIVLKLIRIFAGIKWPILDVVLPRWVDIVI